MGKKYVRKMLPCGRFDIERIESWLQDMAAEGLHQAGRERVGNFERGEPKEVRYRVQPKQSSMDSDLPDKSIRELCAEYGWEFVTEMGEFYIYRSEDPDARELNTEPTIQAQAFKRLVRGWLGMNVLHVYLILNSLGRFIKEPMRYLVTFGMLYTLGYLILLVISAGEYFVRFLQMRKIHRKLKKNEPLEHNKPWKKGAAWHRIGSVAMTVFWVLWILMALSQCTATVLTDQRDLSEFEGDPPFVTVQDLYPEGTYTEMDLGSSSNTFEKGGTMPAPVWIGWYEYASVKAPDGCEYKGFVIVDYYETASPWIARSLAKEFLRVGARERYTKEVAEWELGIDYAAYYVGVTGKTMILCHNNTVIVANVDNSMQERWLELTLERLK